MGAGLAGLALRAHDAEGKPISAGAKLVLAQMALTAKDADALPEYWDGWGPLAEALAYPVTYTGTGRDRRAHLTDAGKRAVARYLAECRAAGLVTVEAAPTRRGNARYGLRITDLYRQRATGE